MAVGLVALSGKVIEHDRGWRAGYATAVALVVVTRRWYVLAADAAAVEEIFADPVAGLSTLERHPMPDEKYWDDVAADLAERLETIKFEEERRWTLGNRGE
jgi:hypothetical protein